MSGVGLDWYKREPVAYLGDVQGLSAREHAVYAVVIDLLYIHGGTIRNDPKFIAGWIADMGAAAVRTALAGLDANPRITLTVSETEITQKRAKSEVKTKRKQNEKAAESGRIGGERSAELRRQNNENNELTEADATSEIQPEKRREEKSIKREAKASTKKGTRLSPDWILPIEWGQWAISEGWPEQAVREQADTFKDYWISKTGAGATKLDWLATWRNWMRNSKQSKPRGAINGTRSIAERLEARFTKMDSGTDRNTSQSLLPPDDERGSGRSCDDGLDQGIVRPFARTNKRGL